MALFRQTDGATRSDSDSGRQAGIRACVWTRHSAKRVSDGCVKYVRHALRSGALAQLFFSDLELAAIIHDEHDGGIRRAQQHPVDVEICLSYLLRSIAVRKRERDIG